MDNIRQLSDNFGQFKPSFVHLFKGVRFGLQTLSVYAFFLSFTKDKKVNQNYLICCYLDFCPTFVALCLHTPL
jgi:hypothetical protein